MHASTSANRNTVQAALRARRSIASMATSVVGGAGWLPAADRGSAWLVLLRPGDEVQRRRVHAVAQMRRRRTVIKNVAQMRVAARAQELVSLHPMRAVAGDRDVFLRQRLPEAGPSRA